MDELTYREGDHRVTVEVAYWPGNTALVYTSRLMRWSPPHDHELIPEEKRQQILQRLIEDIALRDGCRTEVVQDSEAEARELRAAQELQLLQASKKK